MTNKCIVLTTCGSEEEASRIAQSLVENRLAACVNVIAQVKSIYRWEGKVESAAEWLLVVKTTADQFAQVRQRIGALHSYELPECLCLAVQDGSAEYLAWIEQSVAPVAE